jgi:putative membrane protein
MTKKKCIWTSVVTGAIAGLAGAFAMNQFQSLWSTASKALSDDKGDRQPSEDEDATQKTAQAISEHVFGHHLTKPEEKKAGPAVHYGLGTLIGAVYGVSAETLPMSRAGRGTLYGGAVWLFADEIAVPAFGLSGAPTKAPLSSHLNALASHLVFGFSTDLVRRMILR